MGNMTLKLSISVVQVEFSGKTVECDNAGNIPSENCVLNTLVSMLNGVSYHFIAFDAKNIVLPEANDLGCININSSYPRFIDDNFFRLRNSKFLYLCLKFTDLVICLANIISDI